ncbi:MAG: galactokinase family protein [Candidatus Neomarinimicrobiota bacterium]|nr:galactokinase family protein [Candidatus Neomarinimicrobiota bacterium]
MIISSPGRICLFGEHQDYLGLPVIAAGISLRLTIEAERRDDLAVSINLPDVGEKEYFSMEGDLPYTKAADYFKSGINTLRKDGFTFSGGVDATVKGEIPVQAGTSSSSAMVVSWINLLAQLSDQGTELTSEQIADLAYRAEVVEFNEAGGMMDQYTSAVGGVIHLESQPEMRLKTLPCRLGSFVLGDSLQTKDTQSILARSKERVLDLVTRAEREKRDFSLQHAKADEVMGIEHLEDEEKLLLSETIANRDITLEGLSLLEKEDVDSPKLGALLNLQHSILRDALDVSTEKIDAMLEAAMAAGAMGGKINGSGGGGCMFAYAPGCAEEVATAIEKTGGKAYIVHVDTGSAKNG